MEELKRLKEAGLCRIHIGLESGCDPVLDFIKKGSTAADHIQGGRNVVAAGISLSEYVIPGLGGRLLRDTEKPAEGPSTVHEPLLCFTNKVNARIEGDVVVRNCIFLNGHFAIQGGSGGRIPILFMHSARFAHMHVRVNQSGKGKYGHGTKKESLSKALMQTRWAETGTAGVLLT